MEHFNKLTPSELELLALLSEECGEVIQVIGKILRHGLNSNWQDNPTNKELLEDEVGDVLLAIGCVVVKMLDEKKVMERTEFKAEKIKRFLHHNNMDDFINEDS